MNQNKQKDNIDKEAVKYILMLFIQRIIGASGGQHSGTMKSGIERLNKT
ncbi:MAG: hypothetical protein LBL33_03515 [Tannerella sp.]|jgi:hypothetical protein|nr:hypothetical protein [Tannerella sp.]